MSNFRPELKPNDKHSQVLEELKPTKHAKVYDTVSQAGMDVIDWSNYKNYEWSFRSDSVVVLNIWHPSLSTDVDGVKCDLNVRAYANEIDIAQYDTWREGKPKAIWATRARTMDGALQFAWRKRKESVPIRIVVVDGTINDFAAGDEKSSQVKFRRLDPAIWTITSYDHDSGATRLRRNSTAADENSFLLGDEDSDISLVSAWSQWLQSSDSLQEWKYAAYGLAEQFPGWDGASHAFQKVYERDSAYWIELNKPLTGVHLIAFKLDKTDSRPKVSLRIWVNDQFFSTYKLYAEGHRFSIAGHSIGRTTKVPASPSFKGALSNHGIKVTGVLYSVELPFMGRPGPGPLKTLFNLFAQYSIEIFNGKSIHEVTPISPSEAETDGVNEWDADENALLALTVMDLSQTEKWVLAKVRINQSGYRQRLIERWGAKCSITSFPHTDFLVASHILPWSRCETAADRWSSDNGLLLPPGLDRAFEIGDIGFNDKGKMIFSKRAELLDSQAVLGLRPGAGIRNFHEYPGLRAYLKLHRELHRDTLPFAT